MTGDIRKSWAIPLSHDCEFVATGRFLEGGDGSMISAQGASMLEVRDVGGAWRRCFAVGALDGSHRYSTVHEYVVQKQAAGVNTWVWLPEQR